MVAVSGHQREAAGQPLDRNRCLGADPQALGAVQPQLVAVG